jgi:hypothetical protein
MLTRVTGRRDPAEKSGWHAELETIVAITETGPLSMNASLPPADRSGLLSRAAAASIALVLGVATATGLFVAKIARTYATPTGGTSLTNTDDSGAFGGSGQVSPEQLNQPPAGRSHGS